MAYPFLKWPGGKRWLIANFAAIFPEHYERYIEPFVGGGSVFFHLEPHHSLIADVNSELINTYQMMKRYPGELRELLMQHQQLHCPDHYYQIREQIPEPPIERAARFLYLNRTCFNGMYRVNRDGNFNVPIGTKQNFIYDVTHFEQYSLLLQHASIRTNDFVETIRQAQEGDLIFADPPYTIAHNQNSFIKYNEKLFSWMDQQRLIGALCRARNRGALIIATNANYPALRELYSENNFYVNPIRRYSSISGRNQGRKFQEELLISSYQIMLQEEE